MGFISLPAFWKAAPCCGNTWTGKHPAIHEDFRYPSCGSSRYQWTRHQRPLFLWLVHWVVSGARDRNKPASLFCESWKKPMIVVVQNDLVGAGCKRKHFRRDCVGDKIIIHANQSGGWSGHGICSTWPWWAFWRSRTCQFHRATVNGGTMDWHGYGQFYAFRVWVLCSLFSPIVHATPKTTSSCNTVNAIRPWEFWRLWGVEAKARSAGLLRLYQQIE